MPPGGQCSGQGRGTQLPHGPLPAGRDEGPTSEPDEALVDECCLLPSQLLIPSLDWLPVSDGLVSRLQPKQPLRLHFGKAPTLPTSASTLQLDGLIRCVPASAPWPLCTGQLLPSDLYPDTASRPLLSRSLLCSHLSPSLPWVICVTSPSPWSVSPV